MLMTLHLLNMISDIVLQNKFCSWTFGCNTQQQAAAHMCLPPTSHRSGSFCRQSWWLQKHNLENTPHPHRRRWSPSHRRTQMSLPFSCSHRPGGPFWQQGGSRGPWPGPQVHWRPERWHSGAARHRKGFLVSADEKPPSYWAGHRGSFLPTELQPRHQCASGGPGHSRCVAGWTLRHARLP